MLCKKKLKIFIQQIKYGLCAISQKIFKIAKSKKMFLKNFSLFSCINMNRIYLKYDALSSSCTRPKHCGVAIDRNSFLFWYKRTLLLLIMRRNQLFCCCNSTHSLSKAGLIACSDSFVVQLENYYFLVIFYLRVDRDRGLRLFWFRAARCSTKCSGPRHQPINHA